MIRAYLVSIDLELESVTGTLHSVIEPNLKQPGQIEPVFELVLPNLCFTDGCYNQQAYSHAQLAHNRHGIFSAVYKDKRYYVRFVDTSLKVIAVAGANVNELPSTIRTDVWQTLRDAQGNRYSQKSLELHTQDNRTWGYIQVGRSLKELDNRLLALKLTLAFGLPTSIFLVGASSWWLAGLAMRPIDRSYKQMQQFTSDASHELRTPLAAINATVETVLDLEYLSEKEARDTLISIRRQNLRLSSLVQDLLLLSRFDQKTQVTDRQQICLNDLISDVMEEFSALASNADLELSSSLEYSQPVYVLADEDQILRLISNLIANAIKYTPSYGYVNVTLKRSNGDAVIEVKDTGIGIPLTEQVRIFDRFYRVDSNRSRSSGGSGLGLAIAKAIVEAHKGSIKVHSSPNKGSNFIVQLPICSTHEQLH
ncbi:two-component sensor histidine kinase [Rivularia sp. IAM M-261]|nr:two-component sensor histidine kinase [Rivularia sp. IAM M-261]